MKKFKLKNVVAMIVALCMSFAFSNMYVMADDLEQPKYNNDVTPYNIAIYNSRYAFNIGEDGKASCYGDASVRTGYNVKIVMQLQKKTRMWTTVQS